MLLSGWLNGCFSLASRLNVTRRANGASRLMASLVNGGGHGEVRRRRRAAATERARQQRMVETCEPRLMMTIDLSGSLLTGSSDDLITSNSTSTAVDGGVSQVAAQTSAVVDSYSSGAQSQSLDPGQQQLDSALSSFVSVAGGISSGLGSTSNSTSGSFSSSVFGSSLDSSLSNSQQTLSDSQSRFRWRWRRRRRRDRRGRIDRWQRRFIGRRGHWRSRHELRRAVGYDCQFQLNDYDHSA